MTDPLALRLPVELLLEIFKLAADDEKDELGARTAFRLSRVCRAWRALLLDYGPAWSAVSLARKDVTEIMLQRSKTASISLRIDLQSAANHREFERRVAAARIPLTRALDRTRELYIAGRQPALIAQVMAMLVAPKPALEVLDLSAYEPGHMSVFSLAPGHFMGNMPLRRLALQSTHLSEGCGALLYAHCTSLVHLELHTVQGLSLPALLDIFSAARDTLQVVMLESMALSSLAEVPAQQIHLPALRLISFKGLYPPFRHGTPVALLAHITYPSTARFKMHMHVTHATLAPSTQDFPYAHLSSRGLDYKTALLSPIETPRQPGLRLRCWSSRAIPDIFNLDQRPPAPLDLRVTRGADTPDAVAVAALSALATAANIASVRRLAVAPLRPDVPWARILARAPNLNELSIYGPSIVDNLLLACAKWEPSAPYVAGELKLSPFMKRLATLNVFGLNLVSTSAPHHPTNVAPNQESHHASLASLLSSLPSRIEELCVCYCDARAIDMDLLAPLVNGERIVWDGSTNGTKSLPLSMFPRGVSARAAGHPTVGPHLWGGGMVDDDWGLPNPGIGGGLGFGFGLGGLEPHQQQQIGAPVPAPLHLNPLNHLHHHFVGGHVHHAHAHGHGTGGDQPDAVWLTLGGGGAGNEQAPGAPFAHGVAHHHHHHHLGHVFDDQMSDSDDENAIGEINPATLVDPELFAVVEQQAQALDQTLAAEGGMQMIMENGNTAHAQFMLAQMQWQAQNAHGQPGTPPPVPAPAPPAPQNPIQHAVPWVAHAMTDEEAVAAFQAILHQANAAELDAMHAQQQAGGDDNGGHPDLV